LWERRYDGSKGKVFSNPHTKIVHILGVWFD
jgi:hypothetical protein